MFEDPFQPIHLLLIAVVGFLGFRDDPPILANFQESRFLPLAVPLDVDSSG
jgi:hypothetical protein